MALYVGSMYGKPGGNAALCAAGTLLVNYYRGDASIPGGIMEFHNESRANEPQVE